MTVFLSVGVRQEENGQRVALCRCIIFLATPGTCGVIPPEEPMGFWASDGKTFAIDGGCILSLFNSILQLRLLTSVTGYFLIASKPLVSASIYTYTDIPASLSVSIP